MWWRRVGLHVISKRHLDKFARAHSDCGKALASWYQVARNAQWQSLADVRKTYPSTDSVEKWTVFNIRGNRYRLITVIDYEGQTIYIRHVLTHAEYDRGHWKKR